MRHQLAIRVDAANPNHHLWNNHGTWWIHYTLHVDGVRIRRVRASLATGDVTRARRRRDELLVALRECPDALGPTPRLRFLDGSRRVGVPPHPDLATALDAAIARRHRGTSDPGPAPAYAARGGRDARGSCRP